MFVFCKIAAWVFLLHQKGEWNEKYQSSFMLYSNYDRFAFIIKFNISPNFLRLSVIFLLAARVYTNSVCRSRVVREPVFSAWRARIAATWSWKPDTICMKGQHGKADGIKHTHLGLINEMAGRDLSRKPANSWAAVVTPVYRSTVSVLCGNSSKVRTWAMVGHAKRTQTDFCDFTQVYVQYNTANSQIN